MKIFADAYPATYQTLYDAKSVTCSVTGTLFDAAPAPCAVILDVSSTNVFLRFDSDNQQHIWLSFPTSFQYFALPQLYATRAVSGHSVPILACMAAGAAAMIHFFGPESIGGVGDIGARIDAEAARSSSTGLSADEIGHKVHNVFFFRIIFFF
jgi:hypothetical protein